MQGTRTTLRRRFCRGLAVLASAAVLMVSSVAHSASEVTTIVPAGSTDNPVQMWEQLTVTVSSFAEFPGTPGCHELRLFLNSRPVEGVSPLSCSQVGGDGNITVNFALRDVERGTGDAWALLLSSRDALTDIETNSPISVGGPTGGPIATSAADATVQLVNPNWVYFAFFALIVLLFGFYWLAGTAALRVPPAEKSKPNPKERRFDLMRVQLAWWFLLIIGAFAWAGILSGAIPFIPTSVLGLLGLSVGSVALDRGAKLALRIDEGEQGTQGFWKDILTDELWEYSLTRVQAVTWTLVVGIIFVWAAFRDVALLDVDATLVALMGMTMAGSVGITVFGTRARILESERAEAAETAET